jgi:rhodanese-related sulfurtransferase
MFEGIKRILGMGPKIDLGELIAKGAVIVDVRTQSEYKAGNVKGSLNIPLNTLPSKLSRLNKNAPIITCCASGMRSGSARSILRSNGFEQVHNGGSWLNLKQFER